MKVVPIAQIIATLLVGVLLFVIKGMREDIKEIQKEQKEIEVLARAYIQSHQ